MSRTFEKGKRYEFARIKEVAQTIVRAEPVVIASGEVAESLDDCVILEGGLRVMRSSFDVAIELKEEK